MKTIAIILMLCCSCSGQLFYRPFVRPLALRPVLRRPTVGPVAPRYAPLYVPGGPITYRQHLQTYVYGTPQTALPVVTQYWVW